MIKFLRNKLDASRAQSGDSGEQLKPFLDHLEDLRKMIIRVVGVIAIGFAVACYFTPEIVAFLQRPLDPLKSEVVPTISKEDLVDLASLARRLDQPTNNLVVHIRDSLSPTTVAALTNYLAFGTDANFAENSLASDLNSLVEDKNLYAEQRFLDVTLRPGTKLLLAQKLWSAEDRLRLNRLLIEDAFPRELSRHWKPKHEKLIRSGDNIAGGFNLMMTVSFWAGLLAGSPFIIYFITSFVAPAMTLRERKVVGQTSILAVGALAMGLCLGWFYGLPAALGALIWFNDWMKIDTWWTINNYISFTTLMLAAFGCVFEIPVVILILGRLGIVSSAWLRKYRRHAIVVTITLAAIVTPSPDAASQMILAVPLIVLYELCIWLIYAHEKKRESTAVSVQN